MSWFGQLGRRRWQVAAVLAGVCLLLYLDPFRISGGAARTGRSGPQATGLFPALDSPFQYDDRHAIVENPHIRSLANVSAFLTHPEYFSRDPDKAMYRPLVLVSLAANYAWSGYQVYSYHLVNVALHAVCSLLVYLILFQQGRAPGVALWGGLLFALHPLATEPVNYISSRSELLAAAGVLGGYWFSGGGRGRAAVACFGAGLLAKESAIVLPVLLAWRDYLQDRLDRRALRRYLPYVAVALAFLLVVSRSLGRAVVGAPVRSYGEQLGTQLKALVYYLEMLAIPIRQSVHHAFSVSPPWAWVVLASLLAVVSLAVCLRRTPGFALGLGFALIALAPTSLVPLNILVNEHRLYLPMAGWLIWITGLARAPLPRWRGYWLVLPALLAALAITRNQVWREEYLLWEDAAAKAPNEVRPLVFLGNCARERGQFDTALASFSRALELDPENAAARTNLATTYKQMGQWGRAISTYQEVLARDPGQGEVRYNLGVAFHDALRVEQARRAVPQVLEESVRKAPAPNSLGTLQELAEQPGAALSRSRATHPQVPEEGVSWDPALSNLGTVQELVALARAAYLQVPEESVHRDLALNNLGALQEEYYDRPDSAYHYYRLALAHKSDSPGAASNAQRLRRVLPQRGQELLARGEARAVESWCRALLEEEPRQRDALFLLAVSLFAQGRLGESLTENQRLVQAHPGFAEGRLQLANALETSGRLDEAQRIYEGLAADPLDPSMGEVVRLRQASLERRIDR
jgi:tetratricopeptide (TPR) repeat protein